MKSQLSLSRKFFTPLTFIYNTFTTYKLVGSEITILFIHNFSTGYELVGSEITTCSETNDGVMFDIPPPFCKR